MATRTASTSSRKNAGAAANVLGQLAALVPAGKEKAGKATKWELELTPEAEIYARRWIDAKSVEGPVEQRVKNSKTEFNEYAIRKIAEKMFEKKNRPSNPLVVIRKEDGRTPDHQFQFMFTDRFSYKFPEFPKDGDPRDFCVQTLEDLGLHPTDAESLVDNELDLNPIVGIRSLTELLEGHHGEGREWFESSEEDKSAGQKLAALLMWNGDKDNTPEALTPEEKAAVIKRSAGIKVKAGFLDRVATYVQTPEQLLAIFSVIQPVSYPSYSKFAISDTETDRTRRKIEAAADILGTSTSEE